MSESSTTIFFRDCLHSPSGKEGQKASHFTPLWFLDIKGKFPIRLMCQSINTYFRTSCSAEICAVVGQLVFQTSPPSTIATGRALFLWTWMYHNEWEMLNSNFGSGTSSIFSSTKARWAFSSFNSALGNNKCTWPWTPQRAGLWRWKDHNAVTTRWCGVIRETCW